MSKVIEHIKTNYRADVQACGAMKFTMGDASFVFTSGTLYAALDSGELLPGFTKPRTVAAVDKFVALRA